MTEYINSFALYAVYTNYTTIKLDISQYIRIVLINEHAKRS